MNEITTAVVGVSGFLLGIVVGMLVARFRRLRRERADIKGVAAPRRRWWQWKKRPGTEGDIPRFRPLRRERAEIQGVAAPRRRWWQWKKRPGTEGDITMPEADATLIDSDATMVKSDAPMIEEDATIMVTDEELARLGIARREVRLSAPELDAGSEDPVNDGRPRVLKTSSRAFPETSVVRSETARAPLPQCRMTLPNGKNLTYTIEDGFTWAAADTDGLAVDMHVRIAPGGARFVSVRTENPQAFLDAAGARLQLSTVEIPWRNDKITNGSLTFDLVPPPPPPWELHKPGNPTNFHAFATDSCVVVTRDQPHLAALAASLWVPGGVDALGAWRDRLDTYLERLNQPGGSQLLLVALDQDGLVFSGGLLPEIGLGGANDSVPGVVHRTVDPVRLQPWQRKIWIPTSGSEQRWHWDSFTVVLPQESIAG